MMTVPAVVRRTLSVCALLLAVPAFAGVFLGNVVIVVDGDTLVVRDERAVRREVRLAGIDAPEMSQPYGMRSRARLVELAYGKRVRVTWYKRDRYRRLLGRVEVERAAPCERPPCLDLIDVAYAQVSTGHAWHDREHVLEQALEDRVRFSRAEQEARMRRLGLWAETSPMPPWRYRHLHPSRDRRRDWR
jgi:endonuclease YncB( thermonuclease family)